MLRHRFDLRACAMHQQDTDIQRTENCNIDENVRKVLFRDDRAVHAQDENSIAKTRNVLKDSPEISWFHNSAETGFTRFALTVEIYVFACTCRALEIDL